MTRTAEIPFEYKLAFYGAPALMGCKPASLFSLSRQEYDISLYAAEFRQKAGKNGLRLRILHQCENRALLMVYCEALLKKQLSSQKQRSILRRYGYNPAWDVESCLTYLASRVSDCADFPHEIGVFLGYPAEDVDGFIRNRGENCKLCGYWKVYGNPEQAQKQFILYDRCRSFLCGQLKQGHSLYSALPQNEGGIFR